MHRSNKKFIVTFLFLSLGLFFISFAIQVQADMTGVLDSLAGGAGYNTANVGDTYFAEIIGSLIAKVLEIIGIVFLAYMIYGGWIWMKAKGNEEQVTRARNIITNSTIGLLIILTAYLVTFFILKSLGTAVGLTNLGFGS